MLTFILLLLLLFIAHEALLRSEVSPFKQPKILCRFHKGPPLNPIFSQMKPLHILISYSFKIHINAILLATLRSPIRAKCPAYRIDCPIYVWERAQIMIIIIFYSLLLPTLTWVQIFCSAPGSETPHKGCLTVIVAAVYHHGGQEPALFPHRPHGSAAVPLRQTVAHCCCSMYAATKSSNFN
jgi:hypothetical protein